MGEYELIMFLTEDKISVMEVDYNSQTKVVGFHGDEYFSYSGKSDLDDFYKNVCDTYNINDLSELDTNVFLIDCGMKAEEKWYLIDKLKSCKSLSVNNISSLLPILLSKKGLLKVGEQTVVEFLEEKYAYICDNEYHVEELATRGKSVQYNLVANEFSFIAVWEGTLYQGSDSKKFQFEEKIKEAQAEIEKEKMTLEIELEKYKELCKSWEEKYSQVYEQLEEIENQKAEELSQEIVERRRIVNVDVNKNYRIFKQLVENDTIVNVNQEIAGFQESRYDNDYMPYRVYAPRAGKLVWLTLDGDLLSAGNNILGAVGDENDNAKDMIKWLKDMIEEKRKVKRGKRQ